VTLRLAPEAPKSPPLHAVRLVAVGAVASVVALASCTRRAAHPPVEPKSSPAPTTASGPSVASGGTSFVIEDCPDAKKMDAKAVEAAMRKLTEPCHAVNAPAADFLATLVPGGHIEIASRGKDGAEGVIPICIVRTDSRTRWR